MHPLTSSTAEDMAAEHRRGAASAVLYSHFVLQDGTPVYLGRDVERDWGDGWLTINQPHAQKSASAA